MRGRRTTATASRGSDISFLDGLLFLRGHVKIVIPVLLDRFSASGSARLRAIGIKTEHREIDRLLVTNLVFAFVFDVCKSAFECPSADAEVLTVRANRIGIVVTTINSIGRDRDRARAKARDRDRARVSD